MKNKKVIQIFQDGNMVIPLYLLKNYKKLGLELDSFVFLMYLYHLGNKQPFDPNYFSEELNIDISSIMKFISNLTEKNLIQVKVIKNEKGYTEEVILLDDFYQKLSFQLMETASQEDSSESEIFAIIEKEFGRTLSPMEFEIIKAWLQDGISEELIEEALKEATFNGVSSLRYIDKILFEWKKIGIQNKKDVEEKRKKRKESKKEEELDLDIVDWNWFDEE